MMIFAILLAAALGIAEAAPAESPIAISVAVPSQGGERMVRYRDPADHFDVIVSNTSDKPQRVWQELCSWGYEGLSFELTDEHGKKWTAKKVPIDWPLNVPAWWTLAPKESFVIDVYFGDIKTWQGFHLPENGSQTVTMQAVLQFKTDVRAAQHGVWTGRVTSKPDKFTFDCWKPETK